MTGLVLFCIACGIIAIDWLGLITLLVLGSLGKRIESDYMAGMAFVGFFGSILTALFGAALGILR